MTKNKLPELTLLFQNKELMLAYQENYIQFATVVKPLLATVESLYEQFPEEILIEVRSFNDHHVRCIATCESTDEIKDQIANAKIDLTQMTLDCYKCLIVGYRNLIRDFQKKNRFTNLNKIDNGEFSIQYRKMYRDSIKKTRRAKFEETKSYNMKYEHYEDAYLSWLELYDFIVDHTTCIHWAKVKTLAFNIFSAFGWIFALILGALLTNNNQAILESVLHWLTK